jgi:L-lactate dehydrogenase complex protein LldG
LTDEALVTEFIREAEAVGAGTYRVAKRDLTKTLAEILRDDRSAVAAAGLEDLVEELRGRGVRIQSEDESGKAAEALAGVDAGLGQALAGISASGTIVIGPGSGLEGLISILPPHYVALLPAAAILPDVAAALGRAAPLIATAGSRVALVTGPSRTSDIELTPVIGVHGPLRLDVVIVDE